MPDPHRVSKALGKVIEKALLTIQFRRHQGSSYVFFVDGGTRWGVPFDGATFQVNSWSDTSITFTVPTPSGPNGIWHVTPGDTATVQVTTPAGSSASVPLAIAG
jgi:glucan 1,6-alpha-isomaltosidase